MKRIVSIFLLVIIGLQAFSQFKIEGTIKDAKGNTLPGANVRIKNTAFGTASDINGFYEITGIPNGKYQILYSYVGYKEVIKDIHLTGDLELDIVLKESSIWAEEVIVKSTRAGSKTPVAYSTLDREDLKRQGMHEDIPYQLSLTPSAVETSEAGIGLGYTSLRIRGTDPTRINVTINGIPLNDSESQGVFWVNLPDFASSVDNVQIQRGVGTSTNGAGAFGATINFKTEGINKEAYTEINSSAGSFNTFKNNVRVGSGLIHDKFAFDARIYGLQTDGYIDYAFSDHKAYFVSGTYYGDRTFIKANVFRGEERTGISWWGVPVGALDTNRTYNPAGQYTDYQGNSQYYEDQTDNYTQTHYQLMLSREINKQLDASLAIHYTKGAGYYEQYKADEMFEEYGLPNIYVGSPLLQIGEREIALPDSTIYSSDLIRRKWMDNDFYGFTYSVNYSKNIIDATLGGAWNRYDGDHFGKIIWSEFAGNAEKGHEWYTNNGLKTDYNSYVKANIQATGKLSIYGDIQYRHIDYDLTGIDDNLESLEQEHSYSFINPKAGVYYEFNKNLNAYLSYAHAQREPTRSDFKNAVRDNTAVPTEESMHDFELGADWRREKFRIGTNLYYMLYEDQLVNTGEKSNVGYDIRTNVDESYRMGIEVLAAAYFNRFLAFDGNLTLSKNKIKNFVEYSDYYDSDWNYLGHLSRELGKTDISYSPEIIASGILHIRPTEETSIDWVHKYVGEQYFDNTSNEERKLDAYYVNDLRLNYTFSTAFAERINLNFELKNLFNTLYESNAYGGNWYENAVLEDGVIQSADERTWSYFFPQAGFHVMGGISIKF